MPLTRRQTLHVLVRSNAPWRRARPQRVVRRRVQGVLLELPWSHLLPDYAAVAPAYGQNLVALARGLGGPLAVLDVGANVGDSALQVLAAVPDARVLCVEGDPHWATFLRRNTAGLDAITVSESLLAVSDSTPAAPVRRGGTTRFERGSGSLPALTVDALRAAHPAFDVVRLVKSDTDGHDTTLVPAIARAWASSRPVLLFEYDPGLTRAAGYDPVQVWTALSSLGYSQLGIWDNVGAPFGRLATSDAAYACRLLEPPPLKRGYHYWDVAAVHKDDDAGAAVLRDLLPGAFFAP